MFHEIIKKTQEVLLLPLARRLASNLSTGGAALGLQAGQVQELQAALIVLAGIAIDLVLSRIARKTATQQWGKN